MTTLTILVYAYYITNKKLTETLVETSLSLARRDTNLVIIDRLYW